MSQLVIHNRTWHHWLPLPVAITLAVSLLLLSAASPAHAQSTIHVVQPGDSLSVIAVSYGVTMRELAAANGININDEILIGQQLTIPGGAGGTSSWANASTGNTVTVGRGDSLSSIAAMYGMTVQELMDLNGLANPNYVWVGQQLQVVGSGVSGSMTTAVAAPAASTASSAIYHVVQPGDSLSTIAAYHGVSLQSLMDTNGLWDPNHVQVGQRLQIVGGSQPVANSAYAAPTGQKRIVVDLSDQTLTAWQGDTVALYTSISSGTWANPTITGWFKIDRKYPVQRMIGPGYDIPDVPYVMYFWDGYAFHGAYWHNNFGVPMSHGCIHVRPGEDQWLYNWADAGTDVFVTW
ncbi:MAG: LysM peptidoglycan-binding domain-containing protein [Caldilineaceae bacterium]|nr:LysM peptidoglycan-binding domain-containing protein [Caldilineaceae bacterium]